MLYRIENQILSVSVSTKGAELQGIRHMGNGLDYLWNGDEKFWGKKSPVLFPVVGGLKNNQYQFNDKSYVLTRHGFARDREFTVTRQEGDTLTFTLTSDESTLTLFPFSFKFSITYSLMGNRLITTYQVENTGTETMYFSLGGHPAFKVPLTGNTNFEDYYLAFNMAETSGCWPLSAEGLIEKKSLPFFQNTNLLPLKKSLFYQDALVFKDLRSTSVSLKSQKIPHGLTLHFEGFPFFGIWNAKNADFVCLEPWCGIADSVDTSGKLITKEGINSMKPGEKFTRNWQVEVF